MTLVKKIPGKRRQKYTKKNVSPFKSIHHNSHIDRPGIESAFRSRRLKAWWFCFLFAVLYWSWC